MLGDALATLQAAGITPVVSIRRTDAPLTEVLKELQDQTGINFVATPEVTSDVRVKDVNLEKLPWRDALKALLLVTADLGKAVRMLVANGDWLDGASTNRHDPFGWQQRPTVREEIAGVTDALHRWRMAAAARRRSQGTVGGAGARCASDSLVACND